MDSETTGGAAVADAPSTGVPEADALLGRRNVLPEGLGGTGGAQPTGVIEADRLLRSAGVSNLDTDKLERHYQTADKLAAKRKELADRGGLSFSQAYRSSMPFSSVVTVPESVVRPFDYVSRELGRMGGKEQPIGGRVVGNREYQLAAEKLKAGTATDDDIEAVATYEHHQGIRQAISKGANYAQSFALTVGGLGNLVAETQLGGKVAAPLLGGAARVLGLGARAAPVAVAAGRAPAVPTLPSVAATARGLAAATAVTPSMYVPLMQQNNMKNNRSANDPAGLPTAFGYAYANMLVLGRIGKPMAPEASLALQSFKKGFFGMAEMNLVDAAAGAVDNFLPKAYQIKPDTPAGEKYGSVYQWLHAVRSGDKDKASETLRDVTTQVLSFAGFAALHGKSQKATDLTQEYADTIGKLRDLGLTKSRAAELVGELHVKLEDALSRSPYLSREEARERLKDGLDPHLSDYADRLADAFEPLSKLPTKAEAAAASPKTVEPKAPENPPEKPPEKPADVIKAAERAARQPAPPRTKMPAGFPTGPEPTPPPPGLEPGGRVQHAARPAGELSKVLAFDPTNPNPDRRAVVQHADGTVEHANPNALRPAATGATAPAPAAPVVNPKTGATLSAAERAAQLEKSVRDLDVRIREADLSASAAEKSASVGGSTTIAKELRRNHKKLEAEQKRLIKDLSQARTEKLLEELKAAAAAREKRQPPQPAAAPPEAPGEPPEPAKIPPAETPSGPPEAKAEAATPTAEAPAEPAPPKAPEPPVETAAERRARLRASITKAASTPVDPITRVKDQYREHVEAAQLSPEAKAGHVERFHKLVDKLPPAAAQAVAENLSRVVPYETLRDVSLGILEGVRPLMDPKDVENKARLDAEIEAVKSGDLIIPGAVYRDGTLHVDGGGRAGSADRGRYAIPQEFSAEAVLAHESFHLVDGNLRRIHSDTPEWKTIHLHEMTASDGQRAPLSEYAQTMPSESFAEFGRLVHESDVGHAEIAREFPDATEFFKKRGLWPEVERAGKPGAELPEVFNDRRERPDGSHADAWDHTKEDPKEEAAPPEPAAEKAEPTAAAAPEPSPEPAPPVKKPRAGGRVATPPEELNAVHDLASDLHGRQDVFRVHDRDAAAEEKFLADEAGLRQRLKKLRPAELKALAERLTGKPGRTAEDSILKIMEHASGDARQVATQTAESPIPQNPAAAEKPLSDARKREADVRRQQEEDGRRAAEDGRPADEIAGSYHYAQARNRFADRALELAEASDDPQVRDALESVVHNLPESDAVGLGGWKSFAGGRSIKEYAEGEFRRLISDLLAPDGGAAGAVKGTAAERVLRDLAKEFNADVPAKASPAAAATPEPAKTPSAAKKGSDKSEKEWLQGQFDSMDEADKRATLADPALRKMYEEAGVDLKAKARSARRGGIEKNVAGLEGFVAEVKDNDALSASERHALLGLLSGKGQRELANGMGVSHTSVGNYARKALEKMRRFSTSWAEFDTLQKVIDAGMAEGKRLREAAANEARVAKEDKEKAGDPSPQVKKYEVDTDENGQILFSGVPFRLKFLEGFFGPSTGGRTLGTRIRQFWFGKLPQAARAAKEQEIDAQLAAYSFDVKNAVADLNAALAAEHKPYSQLSAAELEKLDNVLRHPPLSPEGAAAAAGVGKRTLAALDVMREQVDKLSELLMDVGAIDGPLKAEVEKNLGSYLTRQYQVFADAEWESKVDPAVVNRFKSWLVGELTARGSDPTPEYVDAITTSLLRNGTAAENPIAYVKKSALGSKDLSILQSRKDIPPELRALWGEYRDPLVNYANSVGKMAHLLTSHNFLTRVAAEGAGKFLFERQTKNADGDFVHEVADPENMAMKPLAGYWTTAEIKDAIKNQFSPPKMGSAMQWYMKALALAKFNKTVLSAPGQIRNFLSNVFIAVRDGHFDVTKMPEAFKAIMDDAPAGREKWREYITRGIVGEGVHYNDFRKTWTEALGDREYFAEMKGSPVKPLEPMLHRMMKAAGAKAAAVYHYGDAVWKVYGFENEKRKYEEAGFTPEAAADMAQEIVRQTMPTYSRIPQAIQALRKSPLVGPFVSFQAEVVRTTLNTLKQARSEMRDANPKVRAIGAQRLFGLAAAATLPAALAAASAALFGVSSSEDDALHKFVPEWQKNSRFVYLGRNEAGHPKYADLSKLDAHAYISDGLLAYWRAKDSRSGLAAAADEWKKPFTQEEMLTKQLLEIHSNQKSEGGQVTNPMNDLRGRYKDYAVHAADAFTPAQYAPTRRLVKGLAGSPEQKSGKTYDPIDEVADNLGVRIESPRVREDLKTKALAFEAQKRQADKMLGDMIHAGGAVSPQELEKARQQTDAARKRAMDEFADVVAAAERLHVDRKEIGVILHNAGLSAAEIGQLFSGTRQPYFPALKGSATERTRAGEARQSAVRPAGPPTAGVSAGPGQSGAVPSPLP